MDMPFSFEADRNRLYPIQAMDVNSFKHKTLISIDGATGAGTRSSKLWQANGASQYRTPIKPYRDVSAVGA